MKKRLAALSLCAALTLSFAAGYSQGQDNDPSGKATSDGKKRLYL